MGRLLLVHFSDIHIGSTLVGTEHWMHGRGGHDLSLCEILQSAFDPQQGVAGSLRDDLKLEEKERFHFVLSGDLTRTGSGNDFSLAYQWLFSHLPLRMDRHHPHEVGLALRPGELHYVPGNHDHWDSDNQGLTKYVLPRAYTPQVARAWFEPTPWHVTIPSNKNDFVLDLFGVDSNSGLAGKLGNVFSLGEISDDHFDELEKKLKAAPAVGANRIRAIVCHHSFRSSQIKWTPWGIAKYAFVHGAGPGDGLTPTSAGRLAMLAYHNDVAAVLTGHIHTLFNERRPTPQDPPAPTGKFFWELRAASATQGGNPPASAGFWVHELKSDGGKVTWEARAYRADASNSGFSPVGGGRVTVR